jgi:hypothetical protein
MPNHIASAVVHQPLPLVQHRLDDIQSWDRFLTEVESITRVAHERYLAKLLDGRETLLCVRREGREHRYRWWSLRGPAFEGRLRLEAVDPARTRVTLTVNTAPSGTVGHLLDLAAMRADAVDIDLRRLEQHVVGTR